MNNQNNAELECREAFERITATMCQTGRINRVGDVVTQMEGRITENDFNLLKERIAKLSEWIVNSESEIHELKAARTPSSYQSIAEEMADILWEFSRPYDGNPERATLEDILEMSKAALTKFNQLKESYAKKDN